MTSIRRRADGSTDHGTHTHQRVAEGARTPVDAAVGVLPGGGTGSASLRSPLSTPPTPRRGAPRRLLHDQELRVDGRRRQIAAHERRHAAGLRPAAAAEGRGRLRAAAARGSRGAAPAGPPPTPRRPPWSAVSSGRPPRPKRLRPRRTPSTTRGRRRRRRWKGRPSASASRCSMTRPMRCPPRATHSAASDEADRLAKAAGAAKAARRQTG